MSLCRTLGLRPLLSWDPLQRHSEGLWGLGMEARLWLSTWAESAPCF